MRSITRIAIGCATSPIHSTSPRLTVSSASASVVGSSAISLGLVNARAVTLRNRVYDG